jgi:hypothetical protein
VKDNVDASKGSFERRPVGDVASLDIDGFRERSESMVEEPRAIVGASVNPDTVPSAK